MRKVIAAEFITLDGVIQAPGGADEDRDGGFVHGGWIHPFWHNDPKVLPAPCSSCCSFCTGQKPLPQFI